MTAQEQAQYRNEESLNLSRAFAVNVAIQMCRVIRECRPDDSKMFCNAFDALERIDSDFEKLFVMWKEAMTNCDLKEQDNQRCAD